MSSLAATRTAVAAALAQIPTAQTYRRRQTSPQFPCFVVGWPQEIDVRPVQGAARDYVLDVWVGCEVIDDDSSDDLLSSLLEAAVTVLLANSAWDVQPATGFGEELTSDDRVIIWCNLPLSVLT